jgi:DNA-directed RNA polymerase subunit L
MSMKRLMAKVEVKACTYTNGHAIKYQAAGSFKGKHIFGDPKPSKESAIESLLRECGKFDDLTSRIKERIENGLNLKE